MSKALLDRLVLQFPNYSRKELYSHILCGEVLVNSETIKNPQFIPEQNAQIQFNKKRFVSRGGDKLQALLEKWGLSVDAKVFVDAGSSTGGFTDCLLRNGAAYVHAVDVGYNQLDYRLRVHPAVNVMEKTNIFHVQELDPAPHMAVADLSFRSIKGAASHILSLTKEDSLIALVKPQFEYAADDFNGIVPEAKLHGVLVQVYESLLEEDVYTSQIAASALKGRKGNQEFFFYLTRNTACKRPLDDLLRGLG